jgi:hypothetical protein
MNVKITVNMDNAAFDNYFSGEELARILQELARNVQESVLSAGLKIGVRDFNGNTVGELKITR